MPLSEGTRLGPYEILEPLGAGGMGEVYRARDPRLERDVAVKVLPEHVARDSEALARFEREARTAATLNDPHICSLHDVGAQGDVHYAVFELLEGETLRERLSRGPLPASRAVELATHMCQGLAAAHAKGIVHRDLKPENLFLTRSGLKILDFGLARLQPAGGAAASGEDLSKEQTLSAPEQLTSPGAAPGTLAYMSPEQARGGRADARSDIFATGVVLFEMLSGQRPFRRGTPVETLGAIINEDPPNLTAPSGPVAPGLARIVHRCLQKDPEDRFQSARDVTFALEAVSGVSHLGTDARPSARSVGGWMIPTLAALGAAALVVGAGLYRNAGRHPAPASPTLSHFVLTLEPGQELARGPSPSVAISPDGTHIAYAAGAGAETRLYLQARDEFEARAMPGSEGAQGPFFSPDSEWVGFYSRSTLLRLPVGGGRPERICDASWSFPGASWGADGTIILGTPEFAGLWQCAASGGPSETLVKPDQGQRCLGHPQILPNGRAVLYTTSTEQGSRLAVLSLESGESKQLDELGEATNAKYLPTGHLVYGQAGRLLMVRFDPEGLDATGPPMEVLGGVFNEVVTGFGVDHFALSDEGTLVYVPESANAGEKVVVWVDRNGAVAPFLGDRGNYVHPRLSPGGQRLAVTEVSNSRSDIWLYDVERESRSRLTTGGAVNVIPVWTPDGKRIAFYSDRAPAAGIYWKSADGVGEAEPLSLPEPGRIYAPRDWSPDGGVLLFETGRARWKGKSDLWVLPIEGDRTPRPLLVTEFNDRTPRFSPDGRWVSYVSDETGRFEVYLRSYRGPPGKWTISTDGGTEPVWSANGRELFYRRGDQMMVVDISSDPSFAAGKPRVLFEGRFEASPLFIQDYDVSRDGSRFLMVQRADEARGVRINVILNWLDEVGREPR